MTTDIRSQLIDNFQDAEYRHAYVDDFMDAFIATQIKVLREQRELTQAALADLAGMKQSQISKLEDVNNSAWKVSTLQKIAKAFDLSLVVRLESFGRLLPDIERFNRQTLERPSFKDDPVFFAEGLPVTSRAHICFESTSATTFNDITGVIDGTHRFGVSLSDLVADVA